MIIFYMGQIDGMAQMVTFGINTYFSGRSISTDITTFQRFTNSIHISRAGFLYCHFVKINRIISISRFLIDVGFIREFGMEALFEVITGRAVYFF